jgi:hypothetical protein
VDTERFAMALEVIAKHAAACAADLRALTDPPSDADPALPWTAHPDIPERRIGVGKSTDSGPAASDLR